MAAPGRKPDPNSRYGGTAPSKQPQREWVEVVDIPYKGKVPKLPERDRKWPARARSKWKAWTLMPHCILWSEADWEFALDTIEVAAQFHEGNEKLATELRNREKQLGTTFDYRRDLRIRYVDAIQSEEEPDGVPNIDDYR